MGSSSSKPVTQNITQTNIPKEFNPYFKRLLGRVEAQSLEPYKGYSGDRIAASSDFADIGRAEDLTRGIAGRGIAGLPDAQAAARSNIQEAGRLGRYDTGNFSEFDFGEAGEFTGAQAEKYMSPYMTNVLDFQKSRAVEDFDRMRGDRNTRAAQAGAFGGSRQAVQEGLAEETLAKQMQGIDVTGRQAAFEQAARQFGDDRAARLAYGGAQAGERGRVETGTEASRQFGAGQGLAALQASGAAAQQLVGLGQQERAAEIQNVQMLDALGRAQQREAQAGLDIGYQDYLRQQSYPQEQLAFYSDTLRGLPVAPTSSQTNTNYQYSNPMQQVLGAGLSGLSLYKAFA
jgi:hypothetical protein